MPGSCRLGDKAQAEMDTHGAVCCPHPAVTGPAISGSSDVNINGKPALRIEDIGLHMSCCGSNVWKVMKASGQVFINGSQMVRKGDPTQHCGGNGKMIEASGNVVDNSPLLGSPILGQSVTARALHILPPLPLNQVLVFPGEEPFCDARAPPGLPVSGSPQVYDEGAAREAAGMRAFRNALKPPPLSAAEREQIANTPHVNPGPTPEESAAAWRERANLI